MGTSCGNEPVPRRQLVRMGNCLRTAPPQGDNNLEASEAQPPVATRAAEDYGPVKSDVPLDPNAPLSARAGGYNVTTEMLKASDPVKDSQRGMLWPILESIDFTLGPRMSVRKLQDELHNDILICAAIFVANEALTAAFCVYWRPMMWSLFWISLTVGISAVGVFANKTRHTFGLLVFFVLQIMFSAINLQHLNMSHAEAVRQCLVPQSAFKNCDVPALKNCLAKNACLTQEMRKLTPVCWAPGKAQCDNFSHMDLVFWGNQFINFMTYAEPAFWALMAIIRMEIVGQEEGKDNSNFRKLRKAPPCPEEKEKGPYIWPGTIIIVCCMLAVIIFTIVSEVQRYD